MSSTQVVLVCGVCVESAAPGTVVEYPPTAEQLLVSDNSPVCSVR